MTKQQLKTKERKTKDYQWGLEVRGRDKNLCQWCLHDGKERYGNQPHHIVPKSRGKAIRHLLENGVTLCFSCHHRRLLNEPVEFADFIKRFLKKKKTSYEELKSKAKAIAKGG